MTFDLHRIGAVHDATVGFLTREGRFLCWTLEDQQRTGPKVPGATAIPAGTYPLRVTFSPRFKKPLPLVSDVPGFTGVRIHAGNTVKDTEGCILVGLRRKGDTVLESRAAMTMLMGLLGDGAHRLIIHDPIRGDDE
jgi:hypothetical protein